MKTLPILTLGWRSLGQAANPGRLALAPLAGMTIFLGAAPQVLGETEVRLAQVTMPPAPPVSAGYGNASGQQYIVYVDGSNPATLAQVRQIQPDAFPTFHSGRSIVQAGRFNSYQNAQQQASLLAGLGLGADVAEVPVAYSYAQPVPSAPSYGGNSQLPALPVVPVPSTPTAPPIQANAAPGVEFGQPPSFPQALPASPGGATLENGPPAGVPSPTPTAPGAGNSSAPYYVVIPGASGDLPNISSRVIQLGTPAAQVQNRTQPLGPHVAVGPFRDRGLANEWSNFFREAGYRSSRVHYDP
ncbi:hypothetical protein C7271_14175 [filamentous cyanobacterium CCP5]|nr:hypothetical protein C7271_14175 [filamentous cyanobacterium CCP5]